MAGGYGIDLLPEKPRGYPTFAEALRMGAGQALGSLAGQIPAAGVSFGFNELANYLAQQRREKNQAHSILAQLGAEDLNQARKDIEARNQAIGEGLLYQGVPTPSTQTPEMSAPVAPREPTIGTQEAPPSPATNQASSPTDILAGFRDQVMRLLGGGGQRVPPEKTIEQPPSNIPGIQQPPPPPSTTQQPTRRTLGFKYAATVRQALGNAAPEIQKLIPPELTAAQAETGKTAAENERALRGDISGREQFVRTAAAVNANRVRLARELAARKGQPVENNIMGLWPGYVEETRRQKGYMPDEDNLNDVLHFMTWATKQVRERIGPDMAIVAAVNSAGPKIHEYLQLGNLMISPQMAQMHGQDTTLAAHLFDTSARLAMSMANQVMAQVAAMDRTGVASRQAFKPQAYQLITNLNKAREQAIEAERNIASQLTNKAITEEEADRNTARLDMMIQANVAAVKALSRVVGLDPNDALGLAAPDAPRPETRTRMEQITKALQNPTLNAEERAQLMSEMRDLYRQSGIEAAPWLPTPPVVLPKEAPKPEPQPRPPSHADAARFIGIINNLTIPIEQRMAAYQYAVQNGILQPNYPPPEE